MIKKIWGNTTFEAVAFGLIIGVAFFIGLTAYNFGRGLGEAAGVVLGLVVGGALAFFGNRQFMRLKTAHIDAEIAAEAEHRKAKKLSSLEASDS